MSDFTDFAGDKTIRQTEGYHHCVKPLILLAGAYLYQEMLCVCIDIGGNLGDVISENRRKAAGLGIDDLAQILMQVSQGLKYIHAQGLVHLDIKPGMP